MPSEYQCDDVNCTACGEAATNCARSEEAAACTACGEAGCGCVPCETCGEPTASDDFCSVCDHCEVCCDCPVCGSCHGTFDSDDACSACDRCPGCCTCEFCQACDGTFRSHSMCGDCGYCHDCCSCNDDEEEGAMNIEFCKRGLTFHTVSGKEWASTAPVPREMMRGPRKVNPSKRFISVEIEVASVRDWASRVMDCCLKWRHSIVSDGSLPDTGFEINTAPAAGDRFVTCIQELGEALASHGAEVTRSCGLHVHVDARDYTFWDVRKFVLLWERVEPSLFSIVARSRRPGSNNNYCLPVGERYRPLTEEQDVKSSFIRSIYGYDTKCERHQRQPYKVLDSKKGDKYDSARYYALNLHSWVYRGTLENRIHQGSVNAKRITNWSLLFAGLLDFAAQKTETYLRTLPAGMDTLLAAAPTDDVRAWVENRRAYFAAHDE